MPRTDEPLGRRRYWPIFEAAVRNNLPIAVHVGGTNGHPSTGGGWPSYYMEEHHAVAQTMQAVLTSLVFEGVFERFPKLRVVIMEGGLGWIPSLSARMDKHWSRAAQRGAASEAAAVRICPRARLVHHPADGGAGPQRAH